MPAGVVRPMAPATPAAAMPGKARTSPASQGNPPPLAAPFANGRPRRILPHPPGGPSFGGARSYPYNLPVNGPDQDEAVLRAADAVGGLMEFWGFKRNMGRMWCVLYLSDRPLAAADLGQILQLSTGAVSMTLAELTKWGVVKKSWVPGERRDYYEP